MLREKSSAQVDVFRAWWGELFGFLSASGWGFGLTRLFGFSVNAEAFRSVCSQGFPIETGQGCGCFPASSKTEFPRIDVA